MKASIRGAAAHKRKISPRARAATRRHQEGIALVTSLVLLGATSLVVVAGASQAVQNEQRAASYRQGVDASMAATHGAHVLRAEAVAAIATKGDWLTQAEAENLTGDWRDLGDEEDGYIGVQEFRIATLDAYSPDVMIFSVEGAIRQNDVVLARRSMRMELARDTTPGVTPPSPFEDGVVGCDGLNQVGSGSIDSFDSRVGAYGGSNMQTGEARVRTINADADANLSGNAPIYGDLAITGDLSMGGSTPIYGNVTVEGQANGSFNGTVTGAASFGGDVVLGTSSNVQGHLTAGGDVTVQATSNPPPSIAAVGDVSWPDWWQWNDDLSAKAEQYQGQQADLEPPQVFDPNLACDPLAVSDPDTGAPGAMFEDLWNDPSVESAGDYFARTGCGHCFGSQGGGYSFTGGRGNQDAPHTVVGASGETTKLRIDGDLGTGGRLSTLTIQGDVTMVVDGDLGLGNNTQLRIAPDANLTVLVTGQTSLGGGSTALTDANGEHQPFVRNGRPAFSLYSAYTSGENSPGVSISGANASTVAIYAPNTAVRAVGSGSVFGAVRAGFVDVRGSGDIHYDVALGDVTGGGGGGAPAVVTAATDGYWEGL